MSRIIFLFFPGLISNLSNSFIKWRNRDKMNSSAVHCSTVVPCATDAYEDVSYVGLTPVVMRKRKAEDDPLPFSTGKKFVQISSFKLTLWHFTKHSAFRKVLIDSSFFRIYWRK